MSQYKATHQENYLFHTPLALTLKFHSDTSSWINLRRSPSQKQNLLSESFLKLCEEFKKPKLYKFAAVLFIFLFTTAILEQRSQISYRVIQDQILKEIETWDSSSVRRLQSSYSNIERFQSLVSQSMRSHPKFNPESDASAPMQARAFPVRSLSDILLDMSHSMIENILLDDVKINFIDTQHIEVRSTWRNVDKTPLSDLQKESLNEELYRRGFSQVEWQNNVGILSWSEVQRDVR